MTRVVWEDKGRARLALYSEGADEWTVLPPTDSVNLIGSELQATEKKLAVSESFTDYEWVCATLNRDLISVRRLRKLAREGAVPVMGRRAIRVTQRDLTVDAKRVWAIDDSDPAGWVDESHLRNMLAYNGVIALGGEDVMRRIFVLPANPRDEHVRRDLGICLQVHRELGIACGLVDRKDLDRELVGDNVLYNDAIVWQGGLDSTGKFFATSEKVEAFRSAFIELWNDPDLKPQEYCDEWIGDWEHRGATNADKEKVTLTLKVLNAEIREIIDRRVAEEKDSLGDGD